MPIPIDDIKALLEFAVDYIFVGDDNERDAVRSARDNVQAWLNSGPVAQPLDAPDGAGEYWFDGESTLKYLSRPLRDRAVVRGPDLIEGALWAVIDGTEWHVDDLRGKWYKRDKAPWDGEKEEANE